MSQAVRNAIATKLVADTSSGSLYDKVGGRIYDMQAPQDTALPLLVFEVIGNQPARWMGAKGQELLVRFTIYGDKGTGMSATTGAGTIEQSLFNLMDEFALTVSGHDRGLLLFTNRGIATVQEDAIAITSEARVTATQFA